MYKEYLLDYKKLKNQIKPGFTLQQEQSFKTLLNNEISKTFGFINETHISIITKTENNEITEDSISQIYDFIEFIKQNIKYLKNIVERHDKYTGYSIENDYKNKIKDKKQQVKTLKKLLLSVSNRPSDIPCETRHYFVPMESLVGLKMKLLKTLVLIEKGLEESTVNIVYLDNEDHDIFREMSSNNNDINPIRLKWIGTKTSEIECEFGEKSIKIPEKLILDLLNGKDIQKELENGTEETYKAISDAIRDQKLRPTIRAFYRRCDFEDPKNNIKISIDSNVVLIKELVEGQYPLQSWRKADSWPFRNLLPSEIIRFSNSIVEITGGENEEWLESLLSESKIAREHNFSKFVHGCSIFFPMVTNEVPSWLFKGDKPEIIKRNAENEIYINESDISYEASPSTDERSKIAIPVRVEPKAFFANERTFLSWVQFAIFLGGIGTAMIGLGNAQAYLCGVMLIGVAGVFAFYALYLFHSRALRIRVKDPGPYEDMIGPMILVGIFILVMILSFIFRFPIKKTGLKAH